MRARASAHWLRAAERTASSPADSRAAAALARSVTAVVSATASMDLTSPLCYDETKKTAPADP